MPTRQLQLASLQCCIACRSVVTLDVRVEDDTPPDFWAPRTQQADPMTGVPPIRALSAPWALSASQLSRCSRMELSKGLDRLQLGVDFLQPGAAAIESLDSMVWPYTLKRLVSDDRFYRPVDRVGWPACLEQLTFGYSFNQQIAGIDGPASLQQLAFGSWFNEPIHGVVWPVSLQPLTFGN